MIELDKIYNEDCLEGLRRLPDKSVDLVVTDPPYLIETKGGSLYKQPDKQYIQELEGIKDGFSEEVLDLLCRVMKKINCYFFCSQKQIIPLVKYFVEGKGCNWNLLSWHKTNPVPACGNKYLTDTEFILFFREKGVKVYGSFDTKRTWYATPLNQADKKRFGHPTCKPINIMQNLIINSSLVGGVILDPFMGSGTTAVACMRNNRHYIGFELNEKYAEIAERRIEEAKIEQTLFQE